MDVVDFLETVEIAEQHSKFLAGAPGLHAEGFDAAEHFLAVEKFGEFVGAGAVLELLLGGHLGVDDPAGGHEPVHASGRIEIRTGVRLDPVAGAVFGPDDFAHADVLPGFELFHVAAAGGAVVFFEEVGREAAGAFVHGISEGRGHGGRNPLDRAAADADDDVGGVFSEEAVALLGGGEAFGGEVAFGDIAPGPHKFAVDAHGADVEATFLSVNLESESVIVDHQRLSGFIRVARHSEQAPDIVGRNEFEQAASEHGLALEVIVVGRRVVGFDDAEVDDLAGGITKGRNEQMGVEHRIEDGAGRDIMVRRRGRRAAGRWCND